MNISHKDIQSDSDSESDSTKSIDLATNESNAPMNPEKAIRREKKSLLRISRPFRYMTMGASRLGIYGINFVQYNKSEFAGLENNLPNSYCNAVLQSIHFVAQQKNLILKHICESDACLVCELNFLIRMLSRAHEAHAKERSCQAANFFRTFQSVSVSKYLIASLQRVFHTNFFFSR